MSGELRYDVQSGVCRRLDGPRPPPLAGPVVAARHARAWVERDGAAACRRRAAHQHLGEGYSVNPGDLYTAKRRLGNKTRIVLNNHAKNKVQAELSRFFPRTVRHCSASRRWARCLGRGPPRTCSCASHASPTPAPIKVLALGSDISSKYA